MYGVPNISVSVCIDYIVMSNIMLWPTAMYVDQFAWWWFEGKTWNAVGTSCMKCHGICGLQPWLHERFMSWVQTIKVVCWLVWFTLTHGYTTYWSSNCTCCEFRSPRLCVNLYGLLLTMFIQLIDQVNRQLGTPGSMEKITYFSLWTDLEPIHIFFCCDTTSPIASQQLVWHLQPYTKWASFHWTEVDNMVLIYHRNVILYPEEGFT